MIRSILSLLVLTGTFVLTVQGQRMTEQQRNVSNFTTISVSGGIDLFITQGSNTSVTVKAPSDKIEDIITEVSGDRLVIKMDKGSRSGWSWGRDTKLEVHVTADVFEGLQASGGSDVHGENTINSDELAISASGGSDIHLTLDVQTLKCETSGGSDLSLTGEAARFYASSSGGSDIKAKKLTAGDCTLNSSGGSDIYITVNGDLEVSASGASDVHVYGNPNIVSQSSSRSSDIHIN